MVSGAGRVKAVIVLSGKREWRGVFAPVVSPLKPGASAGLQHAAAAADADLFRHHFFHRQLAGDDIFARVVGIRML